MYYFIKFFMLIYLENLIFRVGELAREEKYEVDKSSSQPNHPNVVRNTSYEGSYSSYIK